MINHTRLGTWAANRTFDHPRLRLGIQTLTTIHLSTLWDLHGHFEEDYVVNSYTRQDSSVNSQRVDYHVEEVNLSMKNCLRS
jgi:hypothetical protein